MELDLPGIIIRISVMYVYALALLRISGKQSVGHLTAMDFVVVTIIGDLFDDVFWSEIQILQGMVGFATIIFVHILVTYLASRNSLIHQWVTPPPSLVVQKGRFVKENLQRERTRPETIQFEMRLKGEEHLREVEEARWEPKGQISILKTKPYKTAKKKDVGRFS
jgi:uncharacterized membrane protein YcaP (DUF421 family)